jgi:hypothetical protein
MNGHRPGNIRADRLASQWWAEREQHEMRESEFAAAVEEQLHERDLTTERDVFNRLCKHWFSAGPEPEEVVQRVFAAALDRRPDLLAGMKPREVAMATEETARGKRCRLQQIFAGKGSHWRELYHAAVLTLTTAFVDNGRPEIEPMTLNDAIGIGRCGGEPPEATETLSRTLEFIFEDGSALRVVAQRTFALTGWLFRDSQLNMSLEEIGALFDETRAAQSWRSKETVQKRLKKAGCRGFKAPWHPPEDAVRKFQMAQLGNTHRRDSVLPKPTGGRLAVIDLSPLNQTN